MGNMGAGAGDVNAFRLAAESDTQKLPDVSAITYEGIFNEYYFDVQMNKQTDVSLNENDTGEADDDQKSENNANANANANNDDRSVQKSNAETGKITVAELSNLPQIIIPTFCYARTKLHPSITQAKQLSRTTKTAAVLQSPNNNVNAAVDGDGDGNGNDNGNGALRETNDELPPTMSDDSNHHGSDTGNDLNEEEFVHYLTIGLNENFDVNQLDRNPLNLVIALDRSGSMGAGFSFDPYQKKDNKMKIANKAVLVILSHLRPNDRIGILSFNEQVFVLKKLTMVKDIDMEALTQSILFITEGGGTNMELAYNACTELYSPVVLTSVATTTTQTNDNHHSIETNSNEVEAEAEAETESESPQNAVSAAVADDAGAGTGAYSNRIMFLTDAMPNSGSSDPNSLMSLLKTNADQHRIHTTFIGIGVDFNTELVEQIIKVKGGNYYCIHSNEQFIQTMNEEFTYMVTPLIYDFKLTLKTEGNACCIAQVYGSGDDKKNNSKMGLERGEVMDVQTMFASPHDSSDRVKGGVILLKLKTDENDCNSEGRITYNMQLNMRYIDMYGKVFQSQQRIILDRNLEMSSNDEHEENVNANAAKSLEPDDIAIASQSAVSVDTSGNNNDNMNGNNNAVIADASAGAGADVGENGGENTNANSIEIEPALDLEAYFDNNGIRKSVLLAHYVAFIHDWIGFEKDVKMNKSMKSMSPEFKALFKQFFQYFQQEMNAIGDQTLQKEIKMLEKFCL